MLINDLSIKLNRSSNTALLKRKKNVLYLDPFITAILARNDPFLIKKNINKKTQQTEKDSLFN